MIKNRINHKIYIGQAKCFRARWRGHRKSYHGNKLKRAFQKYSFENFDFYILERVCDTSLLNQREQYYLDLLKPFGELGYNICQEAATSHGFRHTEESKKKMREAKAKLDIRGNKNPNYGNKWTKEQKDIISKINKGRPATNRKKIGMFDKETNVLLKTFHSAAEASASTGISLSHIAAAARNYSKKHKNGKSYTYNTAGGYMWSYMQSI